MNFIIKTLTLRVVMVSVAIHGVVVLIVMVPSNSRCNSKKIFSLPVMLL
jgi:hypothetical protein